MRKVILRSSLLVAALALVIPAPASAQASVNKALASKSAMSKAERALLPDAAGKVTRAGKVGNIQALAGDIVLADSTVLHGPYTRNGTSSYDRDYRLVVATQENQSDQVRAYGKGHLYNINTNTIVGTYHKAALLRATNFDYDSAGDGCGPYPSGSPCIYEKNPGNCDVGDPGAPCLDYYALGTYRHKCGQAGWGCNNIWGTLTGTWQWYDNHGPYWLQWGATCSYYWNVITGPTDQLHCQPV
jgi:hypothetical protein